MTGDKEIPVEALCQQNRLLIEAAGVVRVPFLIKGELVLPPEMSLVEIRAAFADVPPGEHYRKLPHAQLLRQPVIDREAMEYTGEHLYQVMPPLQPARLIEMDFTRLVNGLYALPVDEIINYLQDILRALQTNPVTVERTLQLCLRTAEAPDAYITGAFAAFQTGFDSATTRTMMDRELSTWGLPGSQFLDGWVALPGEPIPGIVPFLAQTLSQPDAIRLQDDPYENTISQVHPHKPYLRAMPTRQLHITAGNAPEVPIISALRLLLTKSAGVIKLPLGGTFTGALLALAAAGAPDHPLTQNLSIVYWQGGDQAVEDILLAPGAFDRIVAWGGPDAVSSIQSRAGFTRVVSFNPRYSVSLVGREAFAGDLEEVAFKAAMDVMIFNQKACSASHVQYVEGSPEEVTRYGEALARILRGWDELFPHFVPPNVKGAIKRMQRGKYIGAQWLLNSDQGEYTSGVVVLPGEFDILDHPMSRLAVIRQVDDLRQALPYLHQGVSMAGVYPDARLLSLRDEILARGVSSALPLGSCEQITPGGPQDGMFVLSELVDWKTSAG